MKRGTKSDRQIMEEELFYPSKRGGYSDEDDEGPDPRMAGASQGRSRKEMGRQFKDDLGKFFNGVERAYKIPDQIAKGVSDFCASFGKAFGNNGENGHGKKRRGRR